MAMEITSNYNSYAAQSMARNNAASSVKKKETEKAPAEKTSEALEEKKASEKQQAADNQAYLNKLQKQRSQVKLEAGYGLSMKIDQRQGAVTINPKLLEKMQNDPEAEKQYTELIKNIEMAEKAVGAYYNAMGGYVERTSHWYIDENGQYTHFGYVRRDDKLNKKLREEAKKNAEKLVERNRERAAQKRKRLEEAMEERMEEKDKEASEERLKKTTSVSHIDLTI